MRLSRPVKYRSFFLTMPAAAQSTIGRPALFLAAAALLAILSSCSADKTAEAKKTPVEEVAPVTIGEVVEKPMPIQLRSIGNVEAYSTVQVKSQIGGELVRVFFTEGQDVKKGDPLFQIDPRPYDEAVRQAEAALARDNAQAIQAEAKLRRDVAQAEYAKVHAARYAKLAAQGVVSKEQDDQMHASAKAAEEHTLADRAAVDS